MATRRAVLQSLAAALCSVSRVSRILANGTELLLQNNKGDDAILAAALDGSARPYELHHIINADQVSPVVLGLVYTPFVRLAMTAAAAIRAGKSFSMVDTSLGEPATTFVAFRWYGYHSSELAAYHQFKIAQTLDNTRDISVATPLWTDYGPRMVAGYGPLPYDDIVATVGYPMEAIRSRQAFAIYRDGTVAGRTNAREIRVGRPTAEDARNWR